MTASVEQWSEVEKKKGKSKKKTDRDRKRDGGRRERRSSLYSLNEVLFLLLCVRMVALGVDDGCVGVGRVVRSFGLICQVCSCGNEKTNLYQGKQTPDSPAWCLVPEVENTSEDSDDALLIKCVYIVYFSAEEKPG